MGSDRQSPPDVFFQSAGGDLWPSRSKPLALDKCQGGSEGRIGIHVAGIEKPSIGCGFEGGSRPFAVATVPLCHLGKNARLYSVDPSRAQLLEASLGPRFGAGGDEKLHRSVGADDGPD